MTSLLPALLVAGLLSTAPETASLETRFVQLSPTARDARFERDPSRQTAVVLIHGLHPHPFSNENVRRPRFSPWQEAEAPLVRRLAQTADVYAFAYSQNVEVERVSDAPPLVDGIRRLRELGYAEVVLIGHSAGGLVARHFVEDRPDAGVTKVIQVCSPNAGSTWGKATIGVRGGQEPFLKSLSKDGRRRTLEARAAKKVPPGVEFVVVVGQGDSVVSCPCQWSEELRDQGIPGVAVDWSHSGAMRGAGAGDMLARLLVERQPRWNAARVAEERARLLKEKAEKK